jgi:predicted ATPase
MVTDVANAMILNRLFSKLWQNGLVLVSTSNRAPQELYKGGLQRDLFLPFIAKLQQNCLDFDIRSKTDYRRLARQMLNPHFFVGRGGAGREATGATKPAEKLEESFTTLSGGAQPLAVDVQVSPPIKYLVKYNQIPSQM